jgi:hypothetical protein
MNSDRKVIHALRQSRMLCLALTISTIACGALSVVNCAEPSPDEARSVFTSPATKAEPVSPQNPASLYQKTKPGFHRVPRTTEWEVLFNDDTQPAEYARQLDFFGIELGVISKDGRIQYASLLSKNRPGRRSGTQDEEQRLSSAWKKGALAVIDKKLLLKAGVSASDKAILHYYPFALEDELATLETAFAGRKPEEIRRTRFRVRDKADKAHEYEFFVDEQEALKPGELDSQKP